MVNNRKKKRRLNHIPDFKDYPGWLRFGYLKSYSGVNLSGMKKGFTLIEIIIVVTILAIAAMTAIPMMSSSASVQIRAASNMIAADLEYARSMAISRGQYYYVVFDKNNESYSIKDQTNTIIEHPVKKGFNYEIDFSSDGRLDKVEINDANFNSTQTIRFDSLGSPDNGGTVILNADGFTVNISVEPVTGYISISE